MATYLLNTDAVDFVEELISKRRYVLQSTWTEANPDAETENAFLERHDWVRRTGRHTGGRRPPAASSSACALLDDPSVLHDEDEVGVADRREAVGDDELVRSERSAAIACWTSNSVRVSTDDVASSRMSSAGSDEEGPGDGDQLLLAGRDVAGLGVEHGVVAVGQRVHEPVDVGGPAASRTSSSVASGRP
jgi:hypothetical protein